MSKTHSRKRSFVSQSSGHLKGAWWRSRLIVFIPAPHDRERLFHLVTNAKRQRHELHKSFFNGPELMFMTLCQRDYMFLFKGLETEVRSFGRSILWDESLRKLNHINTTNIKTALKLDIEIYLLHSSQKFGMQFLLAFTASDKWSPVIESTCRGNESYHRKGRKLLMKGR